MEFLKRQFDRIQQHLRGLSASQRMLAGALVIISVMTLWWWAKYAGRAEIEPVLDQPIAAEDMRQITNQLKAQSIPYKVIGDRVYVPADRKDEAFVALAVSQALPQDTKNAFDEMIAKSSPFHNSRMQDAMWNQAKQAMLARYIRMFGPVSNAMVIIDPTRERGPNGTQSSAVVTITTRQGQAPDRKLAEAAADMVVGAVANLTRERVRVVINGASWRLRGRDEGGGVDTDDYLTTRQRAEQYYVNRVRDYLWFINNPSIIVNVKPSIERVQTRETVIDPKNVISRPVSEETTTEESKSAGAPGAEPGVQSNTGMKLADGSAGGESNNTNTEKTKVESMVKVGEKIIDTLRPPGELPAVSAAIFLPRSHFLSVYKRNTGTDQDPPAQVLDEYIKSELAQMKQNIKVAVGITADEAVQIDAYTDVSPVIAAAPQAASSSFAFLLSGHVKEIALGVLALASLLMVTQIVRKNTPAPAAAEKAASKQPPQPLPVAEEAVGEAAEGSPMLDGMEVDEESVKAQHMLSQVSQMVAENPDAAASLVKRWMNHT